jgi:Ni,Fe-hydrogenase III large subunit
MDGRRRGCRPVNASALIRAAPEEACRPWPRRVLSRAGWAAMAGVLEIEPALGLLALWADAANVYALFLDETRRAVLPVSASVEGGVYAALSPQRPVAALFERSIQDLWGHKAEGARDLRPWLDHGRWNLRYPMAADPSPGTGNAEPPEFLPAEGEGLHQVPVGPIHAGIIEPGHFRFTAHGETVVRLEARLGYTHKGQLALMRGKSPRVAARFAARLSGDSTVAHSIAFARATEAALELEVPPRTHALRAAMAELERIANHFGDVGDVCKDASFALPPARYGLHREMVLRACQLAFGHRLMMDCVVPGGVVGDIAAGGREVILGVLRHAEADMPQLIRIYTEEASLADRVIGTGAVDPALVQNFLAGGYVGRATGRGFDARRFPGYPPYRSLDLAVPVLADGDVDARVRIRLAEISESIRLVRLLLDTLPDGPVSVPLPPGKGEGIGVAESFRGDVWHWLRLDGGLIAAAFMRDPSWAQWPLLTDAIRDNIVADFPLCNKSFNCAYSGVDL